MSAPVILGNVNDSRKKETPSSSAAVKGIVRSNLSTDNLILIGMPGCGKSTIGVLLAKALNREFIDSDLVIQKHTGELLSETIARLGIEGFNQVEDEVNASIDAHNAVIATGGSAVFGENAMKHFQEIGTILYLDVPYLALERRLGDLDARGVVHKKGQTLMDIYVERTALYQKYADLTIEEPRQGFDVASILADAIAAVREVGF